MNALNQLEEGAVSPVVAAPGESISWAGVPVSVAETSKAVLTHSSRGSGM